MVLVLYIGVVSPLAADLLENTWTSWSASEGIVPYGALQLVCECVCVSVGFLHINRSSLNDTQSDTWSADQENNRGKAPTRA